MSNEIITADALEAINRSEVDIQIKTAKAYPRDLNTVLARIEQMATIDTETAEECHYVLKRQDKNIEGPSIRFAEIVANCWGNLRLATRDIGNDGKTVTVQGVCHDLETNLAVSVEVKRRITGRDGKTFSDDMQVVTGNAAKSIAFRNALFKVVPKSVTKAIQERIKKVAIGKALDLPKAIENMLSNFKKIDVSEEQILNYLEVKERKEITAEKLHTARGAWNAIKDGVTSVDDFFPKTVEKKKEEIKENKKKNGEQTKIDMP